MLSWLGALEWTAAAGATGSPGPTPASLSSTAGWCSSSLRLPSGNDRDLRVIHAMQLRAKYRNHYEEARKWRV